MPCITRNLALDRYRHNRRDKRGGQMRHVMVELARKIFMRRYWYLNSISEIAEDYGVSESKVKMSLLRARKTLSQMLEKESVRL